MSHDDHATVDPRTHLLARRGNAIHDCRVSLLGPRKTHFAFVAFLVASALSSAQGTLVAQESAEIEIMNQFDVPPADAKSKAIVAAAERFLSTLSADQRTSAVHAFTNNTQRGNWSNLPVGMHERNGVTRGELSDDQNAALDALLSEVLSEAGFRNVVYQLVADDALGNGGGGIRYGSGYYYAAFLGEPSTSQPWMFQFGGHHLGINVTVFGPEISFSPMLTGGQPLNITYDGQAVFITRAETAAAQAFVDSLTAEQRELAILGDQPINLLLGPGNYRTVLAPEGIKGDDLSDEQKSLLLDIIRARLGFINSDDFSAKSEKIQGQLDDTYFAWWGPVGTLGAAYFRITGPSLVMEYAPQQRGGDPTDHAHNIYRDPQNDYGRAWIGSR